MRVYQSVLGPIVSPYGYDGANLPLFKTIIADPPWPYKGGGRGAPVGTGGRGGDGTTKNGRKIIQTSAGEHYNLMSLDDIMEMGISEIVSSEAHLYLWTTNSFMEHAYEVMSRWGFDFKTIVTWVKIKKGTVLEPSMKTGYYFRSATEHVLFGTRGNLRLAETAGTPTAFFAERLEHSRKPEAIYKMAEEQSPAPRLELFARRLRDGWYSFGNELNVTLTGAPADAIEHGHG